LRWCDQCNLPILDERRCGACGGATRRVELTPPGDIRPATPADLRLIRGVADRQFGDGCGRALVPGDDPVVVLNKAPAEDRLDEVIVDGRVVSSIRFDPLKGWSLLPRLEGAARIAKGATRGTVVLYEDAVPFIEGGASVLAPGVTSASESIKAGDEVLVLSPEKEVVALGRARMLGKKMVEETKGICVKVRHHRRPGKEVKVGGQRRTWEEVLDANRGHIEARVAEAVDFVSWVSEEQGLPVAVSFSGGKDSLATLLLVLEAGLRPPVFFVNTGLELPETEEHVEEVAARHGLELMTADAASDFMALARQFGPPARDFRWCCKTQKLGPAARELRALFPDGVLSFIGQRRYESGPRSRSGKVWENPWVPGQVGASPIQDWTALHIWLYLRMRGEGVNPWYDLGLERIGCYLCPASDLADLEVVEEGFPGYAAWRGFLEEWSTAFGRDERWIDLGLWRFRRLPKRLRELVPEATAPQVDGTSRGTMTFVRVAGHAPCAHGGVSAEGAFDRRLDLERVRELMNVVGRPELLADEGRVAVGPDVDVFAEGAVSVRAQTPEEADELLENVRQLALRAELCVGCGVCIPRCPSGSLSLEGGAVRIDGESCTHCGSCLGRCSVVDFPMTEGFEF
jgi:phosphoadenosine phosphosulfate reductase